MTMIDPKWLKAALKRAGKSQSGLARHLGMSQSAANRWANGKTHLKVKDMEAIEEYLGEPLPGTKQAEQGTAIRSEAVNVLRSGVEVIERLISEGAIPRHVYAMNGWLAHARSVLPQE